ncbi:hypothetical protein NDK43_31115 [Neobacillus pocheonensis]|uniref:Uncharacterized protein n=1 Tax=Neobacillus pocheonensis TaxID=363869 RepID=A0ABT0WK69_9BACI|nr:hypothetical protein [Neobacillus pocheonensis]
MVENDNKRKQEPNREVDHFSRFMFGNSKYRETYKSVENNSQELPEQKEQSSFDSRSSRSNDWFFGIRRNESATSTHTTQNKIENFLNNVDFELLMETVDMFVTTSKQFKPLLKEITPIFRRFRK